MTQVWRGIAIGLFAVALIGGALKGGAVAIAGIAGALLLAGASFWQDPVAWRRRAVWWPVATSAAFCLLMALWNLAFAMAPARALYNCFEAATILIPLSLLACAPVRAGLAGLDGRFFGALALFLGLGLCALDLRLAWLSVFAPTDMYHLVKLNRGLTYALLFVWPLLAWLWVVHDGKKQTNILISFSFFVLAMAALAWTHSRTAQVNVLAVFVLLPVAFAVPRLLTWGLGVLSGLSLLWPFGARYAFDHARGFVEHLPDSFRARVEIWDYMSYRIAEAPWTGHGLGASPLLSPALPHGELYQFTKGPPAHPHNMMTSFWVDLGGFGLIAAGAFLIGVLWAVRRLPLRLQPFALLAYVSAFGMVAVAYDFWTDSLLAAMALTAVLFAAFHQKLGLR